MSRSWLEAEPRCAPGHPGREAVLITRACPRPDPGPAHAAGHHLSMGSVSEEGGGVRDQGACGSPPSSRDLPSASAGLLRLPHKSQKQLHRRRRDPQTSAAPLLRLPGLHVSTRGPGWRQRSPARHARSRSVATLARGQPGSAAGHIHTHRVHPPAPGTPTPHAHLHQQSTDHVPPVEEWRLEPSGDICGTARVFRASGRLLRTSWAFLPQQQRRLPPETPPPRPTGLCGNRENPGKGDTPGG